MPNAKTCPISSNGTTLVGEFSFQPQSGVRSYLLLLKSCRSSAHDESAVPPRAARDGTTFHERTPDHHYQHSFRLQHPAIVPGVHLGVSSTQSPQLWRSLPTSIWVTSLVPDENGDPTKAAKSEHIPGKGADHKPGIPSRFLGVSCCLL